MSPIRPDDSAVIRISIRRLAKQLLSHRSAGIAFAAVVTIAERTRDVATIAEMQYHKLHY